MTTERPSLAQLRARVQKGRHREIGNWLARRVARPSAVYGTWAAVRLGASAHQVTCVALLAALGGAAAIGSGTRGGFVAGFVLAHLAFWLDHVDGQVARWRGTAGLDGVYFDYLFHHAWNLALGFALGYGLAARTGDPRWSLAGLLIAGGWEGLSLHNDCRYKAFFQRLKRETITYRVDAGAGGRPAPPAPCPREFRRAATWLAYKSCEPHIVLIALAAPCFLAIASPDAWLLCWRAAALAMAALAPTLALARIARAVRRGSVDAEFSRWFREWELSADDADGHR